MIDVVTLGELLIDMVSTRQNVSLFDAPAFEPKPGGAPANVAVGVQRLGKTAAFIGKVGRDDFGLGLRHLLQSEGVDTRNLLDDEQLLTTLALVSLSDRGDPHFAFFAGAHTNLQPADLDRDLIRSARIFHCGSVTLAHEPACAATLEALRYARANGVICSYDINWRPALWPDSQRGLVTALEPLHSIDIFKMNAAELQLITGQADIDAGLKQIDTSAALVIVTLSEKGCAYRFRGKIYRQNGTPVDHVVDGTGAGDSFMAAILAGLPNAIAELNEESLGRLMRRACAAGAIATTKRGAIPSLPRVSDLAAFPI